MSQKASSIVVLYASQTGNAEWISSHIHHEAQERGYSSSHFVMDDYAKVPFAENNILVFVTSTTGDGDPPDNSTKFWRWFRRAKKGELDALKDKKFVMLGLGDTNYSNFCQAAKRLERKLLDLGAMPLFPKGLADEATGLEPAVEGWLETLWKELPNVVEFDATKSQSYHERVQAEGKVSAFGTRSTKTGDAKTPEEPKAAEPLSKPAPAESTATIVVKELAEALPAVPKQPDYTPVPIVVDMSSLGEATSLTGLAKLPPTYLDVIPFEEPRLLKASRTIVFPFSTSTWNPAETFTTEDGANSSVYAYTAHIPYTQAKLASVRCLTGNKALKRVIEIVLDLGALDWDYVPGSSFGIVCPNPDGLVLPLLKRLGLDPETVVEVKPKKKEDAPPFETEIPPSYYEIFRHFLDLHSLPRKSLFRLLAEYTSDEKEKTQLMFLSSTQGSNAYKALRAQAPTLLDILATFPSCHVPVDRLLEAVPRLQPRFYSVASSPLDGANQVAFAFNIVEYETEGPNKKTVHGLCSTWLDQLTGSVVEQGKVDLTSKAIKIAMFPRPAGDFVLPESFERPIVMVSAGTGITPFIGFLKHRAAHKKAHSGTPVGPALLYHGRRFQQDDALYAPEIELFKKDGSLTEMHVATSREPEGFKYVQDHLRAHAADIWSWIQKDAVIYVCGSVAMAKEVQNALVEVVQKEGKLEGAVQAIEFLAELSNTKRYLKDIWS
ncbi:uncharacterized protein BJ171DRAFT_501651 [Polychytrium aggregatum]|uniref:uncharacterized protein n=1 Tax=Polychytrium aggregatum TaxID=110093 RepID=UPI0022FDDE59|nr:uncharacterized protein BJ171DRAFT_501651 [Polychytrium aggregatum]KAI9205278.1 hypothetical protein BJ171DRAFT_501651 [Polychytrium aggregatum]